MQIGLQMVGWGVFFGFHYVVQARSPCVPLYSSLLRTGSIISKKYTTQFFELTLTLGMKLLLDKIIHFLTCKMKIGDNFWSRYLFQVNLYKNLLNSLSITCIDFFADIYIFLY